MRSPLVLRSRNGCERTGEKRHPEVIGSPCDPVHISTIDPPYFGYYGNADADCASIGNCPGDDPRRAADYICVNSEGDCPDAPQPSE